MSVLAAPGLALFGGHRAVGERQGLVHILSGWKDPPERPLCTGWIGPGRVWELVPWLASSCLHGRVFSRAPCRTSASAGSHAPGPSRGSRAWVCFRLPACPGVCSAMETSVQEPLVPEPFSGAGNPLSHLTRCEDGLGSGPGPPGSLCDALRAGGSSHHAHRPSTRRLREKRKSK